MNYCQDEDLLLPLFNMSSDDADVDHDEDIAVETAKPKLQPPSLYNVVMLNDDYTPMEFVVEVLETFFGLDREAATRVMLTVHTAGKAICGTFTKDVAETKSAHVNHYARESQHPLLCEIESLDVG